MTIKETALHYLEKDPLAGCCAAQIINRGSADILRTSENGVLAFDKISKAYILAGDFCDETALWLSELSDCGLLQLNDAAFLPLLREKFGLKVFLDCEQYVYTGHDIAYPPKLTVREVTEKEMPEIRRVYHKLTDEELSLIKKLHNLFCAFDDNVNFVGFIGSHLEGSLGLLNILPEYRRLGYGYELEAYMTNLFLSRGLVPYCQVEVGNDRSADLQKKLGFTKSPRKVYWLEPEN